MVSGHVTVQIQTCSPIHKSVCKILLWSYLDFFLFFSPRMFVSTPVSLPSTLNSRSLLWTDPIIASKHWEQVWLSSTEPWALLWMRWALTECIFYFFWRLCLQQKSLCKMKHVSLFRKTNSACFLSLVFLPRREKSTLSPTRFTTSRM